MEEESMHNETYCREFKNRHYWLIPAAVYTVLVSFLTKRTAQCVLDYKLSLNQRFGLPLPFKVLSTHRNRWGFALAFGAIANVMVDSIMQLVICFDFSDNVWAKVLVLLLMSLEVGVIHYPMFICMSVKNKAMGSFLGFIYSLAWFLYQVQLMSRLQTEIFQEEFFSAVPVPSLICLPLLVLHYFYSFCKEVCKCQTPRSDDQSHKCEIPLHSIKYVKCLLQPTSPAVKPLFSRLLYNWDPCFCFPAGMITMAVLSFIGVYTVLIKMLLLNELLKKVLLAIGINPFYIHTFGVIAFLLTAIVSVYQILSILVNYRAQMKRLYKGDYRGLPTKLPDTDDIMVRSITYIGIQVAVLMSSVAVIYLFFFTGVSLFYYTIVVPLQQKNAHEVFILLGNMLGNIIPLVVLFFTLKAIMHRFFLQEKLSQWDQQKPLAFNNLCALENLRYFSLFYYVIAGTVKTATSFLFRIILGCLTMGRIDLAFIPSELPRFLDSGYWCWVSMLLVDYTHTNPTALTFCHLLFCSRFTFDPESDWIVLQAAAVSLARRRWWLCYTLVRNPKLVFDRRPQTSLTEELSLKSPHSMSATSPLLHT